MEMMMSTTFGTAGAAAGLLRPRRSGLVATLNSWWAAYLIRRIERAAIMQLHAMSDRELDDIGLTRSQIRCAVRGDCASRPFTRNQ